MGRGANLEGCELAMVALHQAKARAHSLKLAWGTCQLKVMPQSSSQILSRIVLATMDKSRVVLVLSFEL